MSRARTALAAAKLTLVTLTVLVATGGPAATSASVGSVFEPALDLTATTGSTGGALTP